MKTQKYNIGDMLTHPVHGCGLIVAINKSILSVVCLIEWTTLYGDAVGTSWHHMNQVDWLSSGMRHYPVKT